MSENKNRKAPETDGELLDVFLTAMGAVAPDTEEEIDSFLEERGYDIEELNARSERVLRPLLEASPLNLLNRARQEREASAKTRSRRAKGKHLTRPENLAFLQTMQMRPGMAVHFRNADLEGMTDEDLQSMRDALEILQADGDNKPAENE